ncbi:spermine/spermidine synthase domain-containing protein [Marinilabilia rubra]|uniref:Spermine synthase n=1 Tax=Marinilabilia rubra TaxID=2162893 RepID=A0A2U2BE81_9BACT|nr:spermine synthase [Marinilabilia rubra]PWE01385.1 spermine synthase [Marinilabilia rubra]
MLNSNSRDFSKESSHFLFKGRLAVFVSGFTMLLVQVVLLRELSSLYAVNELIVGVFLSFWMFFAGLGAFVARFFRGFRWQYSGLFPLISGATALMALWWLYLAKEWLLPMGVSPGLSDWIFITALAAFIFCFPTGMMFTWFSAVLSNKSGSRETEGVYMAEQGGSLLAGFLFYLAASFWVNAFTTFSFLVLLNFLTGLYLSAPVRKLFLRGLSVVSLLFVVLLWFVPQYETAREMVLHKSVGHTFFSPHGSVDVVERDGEIDFFKNGNFISGAIVPRKTEELLHPVLLVHPSPRKLLLVNASVGLIPEALKYDSLKVVFLSSDNARIELEKELLELSGKPASRVDFIHADPVNYLEKQSSENYDVVLVGKGIPYNLASTRFFTGSFFALITRHLSPDGILATGGIDYSPLWTSHRQEILMVMHETVNGAFPFLRIWAGEKVFFMGSRQEISNDWWQYHPAVLTENVFLNPDFFPDYLLEGQIEHVRQSLRPNVPENTRVRPVLFQLALHDMGEFWDVKVYWFVVILGALLVAGLVLFRESAKGVFMAGVVLGGMQITLLLFWQLVMGDMFRATGLLFSLFMAGLAVGAWLGRREVLFFSPRFFPALLIILAVLSVSAIPVLDTIGHTWLFPLITIGFVFGFSFIGGAIFVAGLSLHPGSVEKTASVIYAADVAGGALGSFLSAIFFVPFTGMVNTGYLLGMAVLIAGLLMVKRL